MKTMLGVLATCASLAFAGCAGPPAPPVQPPQLATLLGPQWTLIPLPNSIVTPGAIVQINPVPGASDKVDIVWLGSFGASCKVPTDALGVQSGAMPGFSAGTSVSIDATLAASLANVSLGLGGNFEKSSTLTIRKASLDTVNLINLDNWLQIPANRQSFEAACGPVLRQPNIFAVDEAFVIADGTYSIKNVVGAKIAFTPPPNIPVKASFDASGGPTGDLTITGPVVFALRRMAPFANGMFTLVTPPATGTTTPAFALPAAAATPLAGKTVEGLSLRTR